MKDIIGSILMGTVTILTIVSYLPQIVKMYKTKSSEDISILSWLLFVISTACFLAYYIFIVFDWLTIIEGACELACGVIIYIMTIYYKNRNSERATKTESIKENEQEIA